MKISSRRQADLTQISLFYFSPLDIRCIDFPEKLYFTAVILKLIWLVFFLKVKKLINRVFKT